MKIIGAIEVKGDTGLSKKKKKPIFENEKVSLLKNWMIYYLLLIVLCPQLKSRNWQFFGIVQANS